jgi:hypothetical protein
VAREQSLDVLQSLGRPVVSLLGHVLVRLLLHRRVFCGTRLLGRLVLCDHVFNIASEGVVVVLEDLEEALVGLGAGTKCFLYANVVSAIAMRTNCLFATPRGSRCSPLPLLLLHLVSRRCGVIAVTYLNLLEII